MTSPFSFKAHGTRCCGASSISGFHGRPLWLVGVRKPKTHQELLEQGIKERLAKQRNFYQPSGRSHMFECTLTTYQKGIWGTTLKELGFKEVHSWLNSNSGNTCHLYVGTFTSET